jgi:hypothetical protein
MRSAGWTLAVVVVILVLPAVASVTVIVPLGAAPKFAPVDAGSGSAVGTNAVSWGNWAGYAVTAPNASVTFVEGSWVQPTLTCTAKAAYSAFWVGIDGYVSRTVERTGTEANCVGGAAHSSAWYEFHPTGSVNFRKLVVHPGDVFRATVASAGGSFTVSLKDVTTGKAAHHTQTAPTAVRNSAEWVAEAPSRSGRLLPWANFGTAMFGKDATGIAASNEATTSGTTNAIGSFNASSIHPRGMGHPAHPKGISSALTPDGTSCNVTWKRY